LNELFDSKFAIDDIETKKTIMLFQ